MKCLLTILLSLSFLSAFSQNHDYLQAYRRFTLAYRAVKGISIDTTFANASVDSLVTQYAIKGYIDHHSPVSNLTGFIHQQLVAKLDNSNLLTFVDPLQFGGFVTNDAELAAAYDTIVYDLRNGNKFVMDYTGLYTLDTVTNYYTDYGVRRWLYNPTTLNTIYVNSDSSFTIIGNSSALDTANHDYNFNTDQFIVNDRNVEIRFPAATEPLFLASPFSEGTQEDLNKLRALHQDSTLLDSRDFYGNGDTAFPTRVTRFVPGGDSIINITDPPSFEIPAGSMLETVIINPSSDADISIGTTSGSDNIAESETITASDGETYVLNRNALAATTIYFTGIPTGSQVYFILKKITP